VHPTRRHLVEAPHTNATVTAPTPTRARHNRAGEGEYDQFEALFARLSQLDANTEEHAQLRERLITEHLPVARHIARRFAGRGEPDGDLVQVATIGLINAVDRYDPGYGRGFLPFAVPTIKGEVQRHFRDATWAMRVPRRMKELHLQLVKAGGVLADELGRSPRPSELAEHLGISRDEVMEGLAAAAAYRPASLNRPIRKDEATSDDYGEQLGDTDDALDVIDDAEYLRPALRKLPERERRIIALRFFSHMTQSQIARTIGISQMHVSRLLARSLARLRAELDEKPTS
jgi:RNA polymerase sigma-B factor